MQIRFMLLPFRFARRSFDAAPIRAASSNTPWISGASLFVERAELVQRRGLDMAAACPLAAQGLVRAQA
jgi:hypothetical protein